MRTATPEDVVAIALAASAGLEQEVDVDALVRSMTLTELRDMATYHLEQVTRLSVAYRAHGQLGPGEHTIDAVVRLLRSRVRP